MILRKSLALVCAQGKCNIEGTEKCSKDGSHCICKTNFDGFYCDKCQNGYYGATCQSKWFRIVSFHN